MTWIVWISSLLVILAASQLARFRGQGDGAVVGVLLAGLVVSVCYFFVGRAGLEDQPYNARAAELAERDATTLTTAETLARLETLIRTRPEDAQPHFFIGEILRAQGRDQDAVRAYQSALRRDDRYVEAMLALADALTRLAGGTIGVDAQRIYARALVLDPTQVRAGFLVGYADWQAGDRQAARARWETVRAGMPPDDPRQAALAQLIAGIEAG